MDHSLLPYTACLDLSGSEAIPFLERVVTCRVDDLELGDIRPGALLTPQGKVISDFLAIRTEAGCTIRVHPDAAPTLEKRLKLFRLRADVTIEQAEPSVIRVDHDARIKAGLAAFGHDFGEAQVFPSDINLDLRGGVDYQKGCFVGQEVASRMKRRGKIRKRTLPLSGRGLEKGAPVLAGEVRIGALTSATASHALGVFRLDHLAKAEAEGAGVSVAGEPVRILHPDWLAGEISALIEA